MNRNAYRVLLHDKAPLVLDILEATYSCRDAQRTYYATRNGDDLITCKKQERELDRLLEAGRKVVRGEIQGGLF